MNSKRPKIIIRAKIHFAVSGNKTKLLSGPIKLPIPGPTFEIAVKVPDNAVIKSSPVKVKLAAPKIVIRQKILIKEVTPNITSSVTGFLS